MKTTVGPLEVYYDFDIMQVAGQKVVLALPDDKIQYAFQLKELFPGAVIIEHDCCVDSEYPIVSMGRMCSNQLFVYPKNDKSLIGLDSIEDKGDNTLVLGWDYYHLKHKIDFANAKICSVNENPSTKNVFYYGECTQIQALKYLSRNLKIKDESTENWKDYDFSFLKPRYGLSQKVKSASIIGIVVNKNYIEIAEKLKELITKRGKKSYFLSTKQVN